MKQPRFSAPPAVGALWACCQVAVGWCMGPGASWSQTEAGNDAVRLSEEIVVSANRDEVASEAVGSAVTVIGRDEIERRNLLGLGDLLRTVPGVEVLQAGGAGKASSIRLRGGSPAQVLVLLDGVRLNTATNGDVDIANLTTDAIERVEVLRGPQAAYGSEAMAGVVSITTQRGADSLRGSFAAESGSREHERYELGLSGAADALDWRLSASDLSTDSVSQISPRLGGDEADPYEVSTVAARLGAGGGAKGRVDLTARVYDGDTALDGFGVEDLNAGQSTKGEVYALNASRGLGPQWFQSVRLARSETDLLGTDPDTAFNNYDIRSEITLLEAQADVELSPGHTLNAGLSSEQRRGLNVGGFDESARIRSLFVQDQWSPTGALHLTGALRHDDHSVFGDETSYRATASMALQEGRARVRASYGSAFRAPNFNELYFPFAGDPGLSPETSKGWDVALHYQALGGKLGFDMGYFDLQLLDLIQFDLSTFLFANVARASSSGLELSVAYAPLPAVGLTLSHTYNDTEDLRTRQALPRRPQHRTSLLAQLQRQRFSGALSVVAVRDRVDSTGLTMDDYERVDVSLRYEALPWLRPYVRVLNALDEDFEEVPGFTTPGATFMVGVRWQAP